MNSLQNSDEPKPEWNLICLSQGLLSSSAWQLLWRGLVSPFEDWDTSRSVTFEKLAEKIPEAIRSLVQNALIELASLNFYQKKLNPANSIIKALQKVGFYSGLAKCTNCNAG
eukprot:Gregarina_sp_Poly_1__9852@NODE_636_length_7024_cov_22_198074_g485_i0_p4_GENE_NODE_636_length_7024_cov_22_198074_g485_i0NODE_636_length_7024_cov_22_198074_g485_i0_p4_ORF_typecomplete_len112_score14_53_NODE_636_length_7024_cov_22_198074_g485_i024402775